MFKNRYGQIGIISTREIPLYYFVSQRLDIATSTDISQQHYRDIERIINEFCNQAREGPIYCVLNPSQIMPIVLTTNVHSQPISDPLEILRTLMRENELCSAFRTKLFDIYHDLYSKHIDEKFISGLRFL